MLGLERIQLDSLTAHPSGLVDGEIWHRSDLNKLFVRLGGFTGQMGKWSGRTIWVDPTNKQADYATVQAAIDAASPGDVILVSPAVYIEQLVLGEAPSQGHLAIIGMGGARIDDNGITEPKVVLHPVMTTAEDAVVSNFDGTLTFSYLQNIFIKGNWQGTSGKGYGIHWNVSATSKIMLEDCVVRPIGTLASAMGELLAIRADSNGDVLAHNCVIGVSDVFGQLPAANDTIEVDGASSAVHLYHCEVEKGTGNAPIGTIRLTNEGKLFNRGSKIYSIIPDPNDEEGPYLNEVFGFSPHADFDPCRARTIGNIDLGAAPNVSDSVTLVRRNRIMVPDQTDDTQNGIYVIQTLGTGSDGVWVRADDALDAASMRSGKTVSVAEGTLYKRTLWMVDVADPIVPDTDSILFKRLDGGGTGDVTAAANITDEAVVRGDGGVKGVQQSTPTINDTAQIKLIKTASFDGEYDNGNSGATPTVDWNNGQKQKIVLDAAATFTFTDPPGNCNVTLRVIQDGTGSRAGTFPSKVKFFDPDAGPTPTLSTAANAVDVLAGYFDGTDYWFSIGKNGT